MLTPGDDGLGRAPNHGRGVEGHVVGEQLILVGRVNILFNKKAIRDKKK